MTGRQEDEIFLLLGVALKHQKRYSWPSQRKILELLDKYNNYKISRRTLNRDFRLLEDSQWFYRTKRRPRNRCGKRVFSSTLFRFSPKLFKWLEKLELRVRRVFTLFRVPKMSHYQAKQKHASCGLHAASVDNGCSAMKVGPLIGQFSDTG